MLEEENEQDIFDYAKQHVSRQLDDLRAQMSNPFAKSKERKMPKKNEIAKEVVEVVEESALTVLDKGQPVDLTLEEVKLLNSRLTQEGWRSTWESNGGLNNEGAMIYTHKSHPEEVIVVSKRGKYAVRK